MSYEVQGVVETLGQSFIGSIMGAASEDLGNKYLSSLSDGPRALVQFTGSLALTLIATKTLLPSPGAADDALLMIFWINNQPSVFNYISSAYNNIKNDL